MVQVTAEIEEHHGEIYTYKGLGTHDSQCGLTTIEHNGNVLLIFSELAINPGTSVTNSISQLATEVYRTRYSHLSPENVFVVEHYGPVSDSQDTQVLSSYASNILFAHPDDTFDLVQLEWAGAMFGAPSWRRLKPADFGLLLPFHLNLISRDIAS